LPGLPPEASDEGHEVVRRAVFLDRDGVINANIERDGRLLAPRSLDQFVIMPGVREAVARLRGAGFVVIVVTNQPDIATGHITRTLLDRMHETLNAELAVDDIKVCPHVDADKCACRKPKPGLLLEAAAERGIDLAASFMVGDRTSDIEAGRAAGCSTVWITDKGEADTATAPDTVAGSLPQATTWILDRVGVMAQA
jgi:D-glycero-D-manno-heptose 1,7-bisphosphate phosphatase